MKSVGEAMSIGRTFKESLQKGIRSMEVKRFGLGLDANDKWLAAQRKVSTDEGTPARWPIEPETLRRKLQIPSQGRLYYIRYAFKQGWTIQKIYELARIDPWFLDQIEQLVKFEDVLTGYRKLADVPREVLFEAKQMGYSDAQLANLYLGKISPETILQVRAHRKALGIVPVYKLVDTCAAEFEAATPYYYSTYESPVVQIGNKGTGERGTRGKESKGTGKQGIKGTREKRVRPPPRSLDPSIPRSLLPTTKSGSAPRRRSSFWAVGPTASARASSSTTAACRRRLRPMSWASSR